MKKTHPVRNPDIVARKDKKEALLFNPADGAMLSLNKTGILLWDMADGSNTAEDMAQKISESYDVSLDKAKEDSLSCLAELEKTGFIGYKV